MKTTPQHLSDDRVNATCNRCPGSRSAYPSPGLLCLASKLLRLGVDRHRSQRSNPGRACFNRSLRAAVAAFIFALRLRSVVRKLGVDAGHPHLVSARRALWRITLFGFIRWDILVFVKKG